MAAQLIDGKIYAERLRTQVAGEVAQLRSDYGIQPGLAVVLVGADPASEIYVRSKGEHSLAVGMHSVTHRLPADTAQHDLLRLVAELNADPLIHGILVQLPLPKHLDERAVLAGDQPGQRRRRAARGQRRAAGERHSRAHPLHPAGLHDPAARDGGRPDGKARRGGRPLGAGGPAHRATAAAGGLHGDHRPFAHPGPAGRLPRGRHPGGRHRAPADDPRRLDQARRGGDRRPSTGCPSTIR